MPSANGYAVTQHRGLCWEEADGRRASEAGGGGGVAATLGGVWECALSHSLSHSCMKKESKGF